MGRAVGPVGLVGQDGTQELAVFVVGGADAHLLEEIMAPDDADAFCHVVVDTRHLVFSGGLHPCFMKRFAPSRHRVEQSLE
jgi:hypothetical protein